jgi:transposase-like protein
MGKNQFKEKAMSEAKRRAKYTLEFKMEAVRLVKGGQTCSVTAKILGIPKASLENWVRLNAKGQLKGASDPDGHPKLLHLWPVKLPQAGRLNYQLFGLSGSDFLSW